MSMTIRERGLQKKKKKKTEKTFRKLNKVKAVRAKSATVDIHCCLYVH